ncbi:hypothetical protein ACF0H5_013451 [Mactra antiquata]
MGKTDENKLPMKNIYNNSSKKKLNNAKKRTPSKIKETVSSTSENTETGMGMKEVFRLIADENGRVTSARLRGFVKDLDLEFSESEIKEMIDVVDPSGKGEITYQGLVGIVRDFNTEFPNIQLTPAEMKRELTVLAEEDTFVTETETESTVTKQTDALEAEQPNQEKEVVNTEEFEIQQKSNACDNEVVNQNVTQEKLVEHQEKENSKDVAEDAEKIEESENEMDEDNDGDDDVIDDNQSNDDDENKQNIDDKSETCSEGRLSKQPTRMSFYKEYRLDSAITTAVGKMGDDNQSLYSSASKKKVRVRSKSESSVSMRKGSMGIKVPSNSSSNVRNDSKTKQTITPNQTSNSINPPRKSVFKPIREPEFYSTIGCSLKLSQIRLKQRLLYIMWRIVYDQAVKKMQVEKQREMEARRQERKLMKKRLSISSSS